MPHALETREMTHQVWLRVKVGDAEHVDHLLELRARLHRRVHGLHLHLQRLGQLGGTRHGGLEVLRRKMS